MVFIQVRIQEVCTVSSIGAFVVTSTQNHRINYSIANSSFTTVCTNSEHSGPLKLQSNRIL